VTTRTWTRDLIEESTAMICKMAKRGVLTAAAVAGGLALLFGTAAPSYVKTAFHRVRAHAHDSVPVQFEIERAKQQVAELEPAIHKNIEDIAREEVEIEHLQGEIESTQANLNVEKKKMVALRDHLDTGEMKLTSGVSYSPDEIKAELSRRLDHFRAVKGILETKESTLKMRMKALDAAREQNAKMRAEKVQLVTRIESIETRLKQIEATQAANEFTFDDTALARAKQAVAELSKRVEVIARVSEQEGRFSGPSDASLLDPVRDVVKEVDAELNRPDAKVTRTSEGKPL
jgi:chromosome segregation ATPase